MDQTASCYSQPLPPVQPGCSADGPWLPRIRAWFDKAPESKRLIVFDGSAHIQFLFQADQADRVMKEVLYWPAVRKLRM